MYRLLLFSSPPPTYSGATINPASAGNGICDLAFSKTITSATSDYKAGFVAECRQPSGTWLTLDSTKYTMARFGDTTIRQTLTGTVNTWQASHELRVSYNAAVGNIKDTAGNALATFSNNTRLTNNSTVDLLLSLAVRFSLNEAPGTRVDSVDASDLTDTNTVGQAAGKLGNAAQFNAAQTRYLSRASTTALATGNVNYTWAGLAYLDSKPALAEIVDKGTDVGGLEYTLRYDGTQDRFVWIVRGVGATDRVNADILGSPALATWYGIVVQWVSATKKIRININNGGWNEVTAIGVPATGTAAFAMGCSLYPGSPIDLFDGRLDEWTLAKKQWSDAEVADWNNGGTFKAYPYVPDSI